MTVTDIKPQKGHLVQIFTDSGSPFLLDRDYAKEILLKKGDNITESGIKEMLEESDYKRAKARALWFLDRGDRTEKTLLEKIVAAKISKTAAQRAISRLKELGLVDDRRFAENAAAHYLDANLSKRAVYIKLLQKGVPAPIASEVLSRAETDEVSQVKAVIEKKYKNRLSTKEEQQKTVAALLRRGFNFASVKQALKEYQFELEEQF